MSLEEKYNINEQFGEILHELVEKILMEQPTDIIEWSYEHFTKKAGIQQEGQNENIASEQKQQSQQEEDCCSSEEGTFYCYFNLRNVPELNHHYYILAFLSNDPFHVTKTVPVLSDRENGEIYFNEQHKFFIQVDDSIFEQCLVLQVKIALNYNFFKKVYDLEKSKQCISELNMDLFHLVRNDTLEWRDEQLVSMVQNDEGGEFALELGVKYNWVDKDKESEFSQLALPVIGMQREEMAKPLVKGHIIVDWEWLEIVEEEQMDVYLVAFVSNCPEKFIKTGLVKVEGKSKFSMNEKMKVWTEGPFDDETVVVLQLYKSLGVKELIVEKSIDVKEIIEQKEWVRMQMNIESMEQEDNKTLIGKAMVAVVWVNEE